MSRLLSPIHRIAPRVTYSGGIRWSSYVGDVRCKDNLSKSYFHAGFAAAGSTNQTRYNSATARHERLLVLGSGVAGCATALTAARHGVPVTVLHAGSNREDCNSYWAQGGIIYKNYHLKNDEPADSNDGSNLVDTSLSLVEDIRVASGYMGKLQRQVELDEGSYAGNLILNSNGKGGVLGQQCKRTNIHWNEDAAWKLACEGPSRVRELLLGKRDGGMNHDDHIGGSGANMGCVVPFDRVESVDVLSLCLGELHHSYEITFINFPVNHFSCLLYLFFNQPVEASHAAPRIIHHADCTGKAITTHITKAAANHPLIEFVGDAIVTDLIHGNDTSNSSDALVIGAQVLNKQTNNVSNYYATHGVVLASGGLAGIYQHSTNPLGFNALGSSVGLALRLEQQLYNENKDGITSDLEYVQFHPTSLFVPNEARFLLTEALRGEGAILRDASGRAFARDYHPNGELAPRDIVARAVFCESQKTSDVHNAFLDITHRDAEWLKGRFPSIHKHLTSRKNAMDFTKDCIPVIPAAHYTCGGVTTDLSGRVVGSKNGGVWYRNLYAAGEAARTGLHGGNRLASTSLLEGLVFGSSVGEVVAGAGVNIGTEEEVMEAAHDARCAIETRLMTCDQNESSGALNSYDDKASLEAAAILTDLKSLMWDNVGVVRNLDKVATAVSDLAAIRDRADQLWHEYSESNPTQEVVALRDAAYAGLAVAESALANTVSGGAHHVSDERMDDSDGESSDEGSDGEEEVLVAAARG